ncbi:hypothetical protein O181_051686 [Austropuccinia psidii MF-1]|uniref:Carbohydrate kinase PfkB domain-containing protein n=1 Tax=Austropuccinia psidii MF-1 TaxID=1389203 RepID=A0A9Q3E473_9BASI|nr:hypothetical protein [Austropuccinia psidii MF-1]
MVINQFLQHAFRKSSSKIFINSFSSASSTLPIDITPEIYHAIHSNQPILALESTILTHGLPNKELSLKLALQLEHLTRSHHVIPAHIAVLKGRIKVGISSADLTQLLSLNPLKLGIRDLPLAITKDLTGGTTVSATMKIADLAGIRIFATGGIGGVHRGAIDDSMDISSDLTQLSKTPVAVISAGIKSILDIPRTLEYLETLGVPVITYSNSTDFPAFYAPNSGHQAPFNSTSALECAQIIHQSDLLKLQAGTLIGVPIPNEFCESGKLIQEAVDQAIQESIELGIHRSGKAVTPWLLNRVKELSGGKSVETNIGLIMNNVDVAAQIAKHYADLMLSSKPKPRMIPSSANTSLAPQTNNHFLTDVSPPPSRLMVIGAAAIDVTSKLVKETPNVLSSDSTVPGTIQLGLGGVALNIARACHQLGVKDVMLTSQLGSHGELGKLLLNQLKLLGLRLDGLCVDHDSPHTGVVNMILNNKGSLMGGVADMRAIERMKAKEVTDLVRKVLPRLVCFDGNLSSDVIGAIIKTCHQLGSIMTVFEPTSVVKSTRVLPGLLQLYKASQGTQRLSIISPNLDELKVIYKALQEELNVVESLDWYKGLEKLGIDDKFRSRLEQEEQIGRLPRWVKEEGVIPISMNLLLLIDTIVLKNGAEGLIVISRQNGLSVDDNKLDRSGWIASRGGVMVKHFGAKLFNDEGGAEDPQDAESVESVIGAGDSLCAGILSSIILQGTHIDQASDWDQMIDIGQKVAIQTLKSQNSVDREKSRSSDYMCSMKRLQSLILCQVRFD